MQLKAPAVERRARPTALLGLAVAIVLVAANLRPAVASVGPLLTDIRADLGMSATVAAVLTALPVFCFGVLAPIGPRLTRRLGLHRSVLALMAAVIVGLVVRLGPNAATLFVGTLLAAGGISVANVLLPVIIKRDFAGHTGLMMGLYSTALTGSAAAGAGLSVPLADAIGHGWRGGLGAWALLAVAALLLWLPYARADTAAEVEQARGGPALWRNRLAWMVTIFFGMQSLSFYAVLNWLPSLYQSHGYSDAAAGGLMSLSSIVQVPIALTLPSVATRMRSQRALVILSVVMTALGFLGLLLAPTAAAVLWVVVLGIGQGAAFPLALTLLVLRTREHRSTAALSAMAQSVGYSFAGFGPLAFGALHAVSGGWSVPLIVLLVLLVPQLVMGLQSAAPKFVTVSQTVSQLGRTT